MQCDGGGKGSDGGKESASRKHSFPRAQQQSHKKRGQDKNKIRAEAIQLQTYMTLFTTPMGDLDEQATEFFKIQRAQVLSLLSWRTRLSIAVDVAQGLVYLHEEIKVPIIHRDLKAQNILLDADMSSKLADFGISKFLKSGNEDGVTASQWCGAMGYIPPEYVHDTRVSRRGDVYSYGIILLELLTGKPPTLEDQDQDQDQDRDVDLEGNENSFKANDVQPPLVNWVSKWAQSPCPLAVVDPVLHDIDGNFIPREAQQMRLMIQVGLLCTQDNPHLRPRMHDVLAMLTQVQSLGEDLIPTMDELAQDLGEASSDEHSFSSISSF